MQYIIADISTAINAGFKELGHSVNGNLICLNEREVKHAPSLKGTLHERAISLNGVIVDRVRALELMNIK